MSLLDIIKQAAQASTGISPEKIVNVFPNPKLVNTFPYQKPINAFPNTQTNTSLKTVFDTGRYDTSPDPSKVGDNPNTNKLKNPTITIQTGLPGTTKSTPTQSKSTQSNPFSSDPVLQWYDIADKYAKKYGVPTQLVLGLISVESGGDKDAVNKQSGAAGLMQLMPATAKELGVKNPFDPEQNIEAGVRYLAQLYKQTGNWDNALALYGGFGKQSISSTSTNASVTIPNVDTSSIDKQIKQIMSQITSPEELRKIQQQVAATNAKLFNELAKNNEKFQDTLDKVSETLKTIPDAPQAADYNKIAQDNAKLMPLMVTLITLGTAIFGNKSGTTLADKFNNMFEALNQKNLKDYEIARQKAQDELQRWQNNTKIIFDKLNTAVALAVQGKNATDVLLQTGITINNNTLSNLLAIDKAANEMLMMLEKMKNDLIETSIKFANLGLEGEKLELGKEKLDIDRQKLGTYKLHVLKMAQYYDALIQKITNGLNNNNPLTPGKQQFNTGIKA
jgi:soluble lytic murein transglycosylase-like protein